MWEVYSVTLADFVEAGDMIQQNDKIYLVDQIDFDDEQDCFVITGVEQEWEETETFTIPDGHMVELVFWSED